MAIHNTDEDIKDVVDNIMTIMTDSSLDESFFEMVLKRLDSFGYILDVSHDGWVIAFATQKIQSQIKNECYTTNIPDGLIATAVDMICGEFLFSKNQSGQLSIEGLDLDGAVSSIKTGDTSVNFDTGTSDEGKFLHLVDCLMNCGRGEFACFRRMQW